MTTRSKPNSDRVAGHDVGRDAQLPGQIPWRGLKQVLKRVAGRTAGNNIGLISAGVAFYSLLALFPALAALVSVYGLVFDPVQVDQQFSTVSEFLPAEVSQMISGQMRELASGPSGALGAGLAGALLVSIWSATRGTRSLITALNITYDEDESRGFFRLNLFAFAMTLFLIVLGAGAIAAIVALPIVFAVVGLGALAEALLQWLRWPLLAMVVLFMLAVIYRYGPSRRKARWHWVSWGSIIAVVLWLLASGLFSYYVANFASYNATYGSIGAVIIMLMWLFISAFVVLLGAEVNAEMERQTAVDTTHGRAQPSGERGAYVADHLPDDHKR